MVKYSDSFEETVVHTAAGDKYSEWFDVSWANELYIYCTITFALSKTGDESLTVNKLERNTPGVLAVLDEANDDVSAFTVPKNATAAEEEEYASNNIDGGAGVAAWNKIGTRVRFLSTTTGNSFTNLQSISIVYTIYAKRN